MSIRLPATGRGATRGPSKSVLAAGVLTAALGFAPASAAAQATQQLPPLPPLPATRVDDRLPAKARQPFSLTFAEPQPVRDVLLLIVKDTGLSVVIDPDVTGTFAGELSNVTLRQALDIVLPPLGLQHTLTASVLRIARRPTETRFFTVDHVATRRSSERTTAAAAGVAAGVTSADAADFYDEMTGTIGPLLSSDGTFTVDRKTGLVRVTDYPDRLDRVSHYLELAEVRATRQVQVEATFVEIELKDPAAPGIDWKAVLQAAGDAATPSRRLTAAGGVLSIGLDVRRLDGLLAALATQGRVNVVARPRVAVMNNEPAIVRSAAQPNDGVVLAVTPQVSADRAIQLSVAPGAGDGARVRAIDTLVRVQEGETVVIDGLTQPAPGRKTELLILLKATIVEPYAAVGGREK